MDAKIKSSRGGFRKGSGRPKSDDPTKKFSMSAHLSEYNLIEKAALAEGKSISRYLVDLALEDISKRN